MGQHAVYLAVIAVLVLVLVYAAARAVKAHRTMTDLEARFGIGSEQLASPRARPLRERPVDLLAERTYEEYRREVDEVVERALAMGEFGDQSRLSEACGLALKGGKRLRAIVTLEVARAVSAQQAGSKPGSRRFSRAPAPLSPVDAMEAALFIEYVHAAALIIDDLPCFDDDALRRGGPALHVAVGPAVAQLAALALVSAAYQNICRQVDWIRANCPESLNADRIGMQICGEASRAMGAMGAAGGQYMDISDAGSLAREYSDKGVELITYRKTATFFEIACVAGWLAGGGTSGSMETLREVGKLVGTAFQIADDIGDMDVDRSRALEGKPGWNFAEAYGRDVAVRELDRNLRGARLLLTQVGLWTPLWEKDLYPRIRAMANPTGQENGAAIERVVKGPTFGGQAATQGGAPSSPEPSKAAELSGADRAGTPTTIEAEPTASGSADGADPDAAEQDRTSETAPVTSDSETERRR